jgi:hypothetical protein
MTRFSSSHNGIRHTSRFLGMFVNFFIRLFKGNGLSIEKAVIVKSGLSTDVILFSSAVKEKNHRNSSLSIQCCAGT